MAVLAVYRNGVFRFYQGVDQFDFLLAGMSGYVNVLEYNVCALCGQFVDDVRNGFLISRDRVRAEDHGVTRQDRDLFVQVCRHTGQRCHGLALASGGDQDKLLAGVVFHLLDIDQGVFRDIDVAQLLRDGDDVDHAAAFDDNFTAVFVSGVDDLLHTVNVRCEGCDDDAGILMLGKQAVDCLSYGPLGHGKARTLCVCTVAHQCQNAFLSDLGESLQVDDITKDWCVVDFEVSGVDDDARRGVDGQCCCICNTMVCFDKLDAECAQIDGLSVFDDFPFCGTEQVVLL